jgi:hypothetical protein
MKNKRNGNGSTEFPTDVLPLRYEDAICEISQAFGVPVQIPAMAFLTGTAACVGNVVCVEAKPGWQEYANIFAVSVGDSTAGKSPATRAILQPIHEFELWRRYEEEKAIAQPGYLSAFAGFPNWNTLIVDDITLPALSTVLANNPRGVLWNRDEIDGLFIDMRRSSLLKSRIRSSFDSGPWQVHRVNGDRTFYIPRATLSISGTIQPKILGEIFSEKDIESGLLPRVLFFRANSDTPRYWSNAAFTQERKELLALHYLELLKVDYEQAGNRMPRTVRLTPDALAAFVNFFDKTSFATWFRNPKMIDAFKEKARSYVLRLALLISLCEWISGDVSTLNWVQAKTMERAIALGQYFTRETRKVYEIIFKNSSPLEPKKLRVAKAIISLSPRIKGGLLATKEITNHCNQQLPSGFHLSVRQVGKAAASLGLQTGQHMPGQSIRGVGISPQDVMRLRSML